MDFKALSATILEELAEPGADNLYISAKLRACLEKDEAALYEIMDKKTKELQKKLAEATERTTALTEETAELHTSVERAVHMKIVYITQQFEKEKSTMMEYIRTKEAELAQAHTTFTQMNEYIQKMHTEMMALKAALMR
jgi:hypothetical protein